MYIVNPFSITNTFVCNKTLGKHLIKKHDIPVLANKDGKYVFSDTQDLREALKELPLMVKIFGK